MRNLILTITLIISLNASACPKYKMINQGDSVPCKGIFINQPTNELIKKDLRDNKLKDKKIKLKDLQISTLKEDRDKWAKEAHVQAKARYEQRNDLKKGFLYGIGLTLAVMFISGR